MLIKNIGQINKTYQLHTWENWIYLIQDSKSLHISIDNNNCVIEGVAEKALKLSCKSVSVSEESINDSHISFQKTLTFVVDGKQTKEFLQGRYFVFVKDNNGDFFCVNPSQTLQVSYEYTLDKDNNFTKFNLSIQDNFPIMYTEGITVDDFDEIPCKYQHNTLVSLKLNERKYSKLGSEGVLYTNRGFKDIYYSSCNYTESFDGEQLTETITFSLNLENENSVAAYNLLIYPENRYAALLYFSNGDYLACGFANGFQPSYSVSSDNGNNIQITLTQISDISNLEKILQFSDSISDDPSTSWVFTKDYDGYECIGINQARYLLKKEIDANNNETGRFQCLQGYETQFSNLNIIGTFSETQTFSSFDCGLKRCELESNIPSLITLKNQTCNGYTLKCDSDWNVTQDGSSGFTFSPMSGEGGKTYNIVMCNNNSSSSLIGNNATFYINYCLGQKKVITVSSSNSSLSCLPQGSSYQINAKAQNINIPTTCVAGTASANTEAVVSISVNLSSVLLSIAQNNTGQKRSIHVTIVWQNGGTSSITITQDKVYEKWIADGWTCSNGKKYEVLYQYVSYSENGIFTPTGVAKLGEELEDTNGDCGSTQYRWTPTTATTCDNGKKYIIENQEVSYDGGNVWQPTGVTRLGSEVDDPNGDCAEEVEYEYRWIATNLTVCGNNLTKIYNE